jgi:hypothetical protein
VTKRRIAVFLAVPTLALAACGGDSDEDQIKDIINDVSKNAETICDKSTDRLLEEQLGGSKEECEKQAKEAEEGDTDGDVENIDVEIDGDKATAKFKDNEGDDNTVDFVKEDGDWMIDKIA